MLEQRSDLGAIKLGIASLWRDAEAAENGLVQTVLLRGRPEEVLLVCVLADEAIYRHIFGLADAVTPSHCL